MSPVERHTRNTEDPSEAAEYARALGFELGVPLTPERLVEIAARMVPHAAGCAITYIAGRSRPHTLASTGDMAPLIDELQYETGEGPCLDALDNRVVDVPDMLAETRWPHFAQLCLEQTSVHSMLSVQLVLEGDNWAALNFYALEAHGFRDDDVALTCMFAPFVALSVQTVLERRRADNLDKALQNSRNIGSAVGILMAHRRITADEALAELRAVSRNLNRKMRDVAAEVELTGALPETKGDRGLR